MPQELGVWLRQQRQTRGWPIPEMARQLRRAATASGDALPGNNGLHRNIRRWESGTGSLSERYKLHYCNVLGILPARFGPGHPAGPRREAADTPASQAAVAADGAAARPGGRPAHELLASDLRAGPAAPGRDRGNGSHRQEPGDREWPVDAGIWPERLIAAMAAQSQEFGEWAGMSEVADTTIERYAVQVRQLAKDFEHAPPFPLMLETGRLRDRVVSSLRGHLRPDQARELRPVLDLHPDSRIDPVIQRLTGLRNAFMAPRFASLPQARQLQEEIETYCGEAITRQISA
jgi:hypothetical protein